MFSLHVTRNTWAFFKPRHNKIWNVSGNIIKKKSYKKANQKGALPRVTCTVKNIWKVVSTAYIQKSAIPHNIVPLSLQTNPGLYKDLWCDPQHSDFSNTFW